MSLKDTNRYKQLKEAMGIIEELKIPDHLQQEALQHLLESSQNREDNPAASQKSPTTKAQTAVPHTPGTTGLRDFIKEKKAKAAGHVIPCLYYWVRENEGTEKLNEMEVLALYRRTNIRPPKNIGQAMRDLSSARYMRLKSVKGEKGYYQLAQAGEDFILHDLGK